MVLTGTVKIMFSKGNRFVDGLRKCRDLRRFLHGSSYNLKYNQPLSGHDMPRAGGIASMMRLPVQNSSEGAIFHNFIFLNQSVVISRYRTLPI